MLYSNTNIFLKHRNAFPTPRQYLLELFMGPHPIHQGPTLMTSSHPDYLLKAPPPNSIRLRGRVLNWGEGHKQLVYNMPLLRFLPFYVFSW